MYFLAHINLMIQICFYYSFKLHFHYSHYSFLKTPLTIDNMSTNAKACPGLKPGRDRNWTLYELRCVCWCACMGVHAMTHPCCLTIPVVCLVGVTHAHTSPLQSSSPVLSCAAMLSHLGLFLERKHCLLNCCPHTLCVCVCVASSCIFSAHSCFICSHAHVGCGSCLSCEVLFLLFAIDLNTLWASTPGTRCGSKLLYPSP